MREVQLERLKPEQDLVAAQPTGRMTKEQGRAGVRACSM
jgi:hypothetical protein